MPDFDVFDVFFFGVFDFFHFSKEREESF